jgi:pimeloyl-ACP methyl ester carboxylesterase
MPIQRPATYLESFVNASDVDIHYAEVSKARRPMILLHGIGMDWRVWQAVSRRLRPHFHLLMLDLRGHGKSSKPVTGYSVAHYAADVEDVLDALRLQDVVLVGSSLGGVIASAVEAPRDIVAQRILVDPPLTGGPVRDPEGFREILALKQQSPVALAEYLQRGDPSIGRDLARTMAEMWHESADGVITEMLAHSDDYFAVDEALRADESPTLLLQADPGLDPTLTTRDAEHALALLPRGEALVVPGARHAIHASRPDEFVRLVLDFSHRT